VALPVLCSVTVPTGIGPSPGPTWPLLLPRSRKKGAHLQLVGEVRTREYEKEYGSEQKFTVKHRVCEISLESILKLDRAERQEEPAPDIEPTDDPP
jgi:single-stranded DNA-binding protein